jgi:Cys-tRNA(Pro)/Cys-tRNA(Cys) deacylase
MSGEKNNVMRLLDRRGISYQAYAFSPDIHSAQGVAEVTGLPAAMVFKTLVAMPAEGRPILVLVPGDHELDLRRLARALGIKKARMATKSEAERFTGLQVGGISPLALLDRGFRVYLDHSALVLDDVLVSAGERGKNVRLRTTDLIAVTAAEVIEAAG